MMAANNGNSPRRLKDSSQLESADQLVVGGTQRSFEAFMRFLDERVPVNVTREQRDSILHPLELAQLRLFQAAAEGRKLNHHNASRLLRDAEAILKRAGFPVPVELQQARLDARQPLITDPKQLRLGGRPSAWASFRRELRNGVPEQATALEWDNLLTDLERAQLRLDESAEYDLHGKDGAAIDSWMEAIEILEAAGIDLPDRASNTPFELDGAHSPDASFGYLAM
jgi:hypothetical protein